MKSTYYSRDPRRLWNRLRCITDYEGKNREEALSTASLPEKFNTFYTRFDTNNPILTLDTAAVRQTLGRVNPHKAPEPNGIPGRP